MKNTTTKKLILNKKTLRALKVKTSIKTGISGNGCATTRLTNDPIRNCTRACD